MAKIQLIDYNGNIVKEVEGINLTHAVLRLWMEIRCDEGPLAEEPEGFDNLKESIADAFDGEYSIAFHFEFEGREYRLWAKEPKPLLEVKEDGCWIMTTGHRYVEQALIEAKE